MSKIFPLNWRFVSALDPQVDLMLVRDLDSEISPREFSAFDEFAQSAQKFHIIQKILAETALKFRIGAVSK